MVDGQAASDVDRLQTVCDYLELELALADLGAVWSGVVATPPGTDRRVRFAVFGEQAEILEQCCRYAESCLVLAESMVAAPLPIPEPDWVAGQAREWLKRFSNRPCTTWGGRGTSARTDAGGPMRAYSMDLRERALLDSDAGMKAADVAAKYRVSGSWVRLLKQRRRDTGEVAPRVQRQGRRGMLEPHLHTLAALIAAHPDRTLAELKDALATPASVPTVWRAVRALGLTVTKNGPPVRTRSA